MFNLEGQFKNDDNLSEKELKKLLKGKNIIDKGTIIINSQQDYEKAMKYVEALTKGNDFYKPAGLNFADSLKRGNIYDSFTS